ncbi:hypothetical protein, partial [Siccirubricoccus deserti]|uniref:hypothetical protein n=1 Tax=Siccirubricoccus deserti TaxID=2013562 RepID=UPI001C98AAFE
MAFAALLIPTMAFNRLYATVKESVDAIRCQRAEREVAKRERGARLPRRGLRDRLSLDERHSFGNRPKAE